MAPSELNSAWFGPVVEQLAGVQNELTSLLATEGSADSSYKTDLTALVNNENVLTNLLVQVAASGSNPTDM
ncbi:MAG TPA: hypothetical protein VG122_03170 [Gemmata sp.]|nr:hypothetical protein [Gemmata sp.]